MYQHIQLRRLSNLSSNTTSQKVDGLDAFKQKETSDVYGEDDVLILKELSHKMEELEEVILVEDEPALRLPQLSNESWIDFVEELSKKYEHDDLLSTSVPQSRSSTQRLKGSINLGGVVSISSDEDEQSSIVLPTEHMNSSKDDFSSTIEVFPTTNTCTPAHGGNNEGIARLEELSKLVSGHSNDNCATVETRRENNEPPQQSTEPIFNVKSGVAGDNNQIRQNTTTAPNNSTSGGDNVTLRSKAPNSSNHKGLTGINKKYQDIKRRTYKLTFHQILQIFDVEKSVPSTIGAIPGEPIELDFPERDMKEFVKIVKNYQETESKEDVRHLWTQIKSCLSAMKPAYGTTTNYTKYHKKLNWYITELMAQYIKFEIENSIQNENYYKLKMEALMNSVSSLLNDDVNLKILTLLRTNFPDKPSNFLDDLFKKFLTHPNVRLENNDYGIYRMKVLAFQKWMHYSNRKKSDIVDIAIKEGSAYLPRLVPTNTENPFYTVDQHVHIIDDYDKQGTRKLLEENISIDVLKATINKYLQVYETQLYDDIGYRSQRRQGLEHSQTLAAREDAMQTHRHSPKAITMRSDACHCNRRRTHQPHTHHHNNNNNSSRATHLPAGCDIQRNRLSSSPLRSNRCSCKSLVAKHQSDTSLSCKTPSSNAVISLDSTDDEDDNVEQAKVVSTEKSSMITEKRNQSTQQRVVRRVRPALQPQTVDNRQIRHITQKRRPRQAHALRHKQIPPKKVDTIVLDSSSEGEEETGVAPVSAAEVNKPKLDKLDDTQTEEPITPTAQPQQTQQQAARPRLQSVSMPLRCALIGSVAIKPIRKEKHCIPGEVSSTTSHDINELERLCEAPAVSCSANVVANNASAYENAREVGTVEILERRELHQPVVMAERCFQPGKLLLGIDYSDDENEDDVAERGRENIAAGSDAGDDDSVSSGCFIPMVGGYSKVVEEATSSTEVFQRIQSLENVVAADALNIVQPAPVVMAELVDRTALGAAVSEDAPTCSRYANNNAMNPQLSKEDTQKEYASAPAPQPLELSRGNPKITVRNFASANIIGKRNNTVEDSLGEDVESVPPAFGLLAGLENKIESQQISAENIDEPSIKPVPPLAVEPTAINKDKHDIPLELTNSAVKNNAAHLSSEDDEMAAIDQMLADIDEHLRESHEFNKKYLKGKNVAGEKGSNLEKNLTENTQNEPDLTNTESPNRENNFISRETEKIVVAVPAISALTHSNDEELMLDVCETVPEGTKSLVVDAEVEASVTVGEIKLYGLTEDASSNENQVLCEKSCEAVEKLTTVDDLNLKTLNDLNSEGTEEVIATVPVESECLNKNDEVSKENSSSLDAACPNKVSKITQASYEEEAIGANVSNQEGDICPIESKTTFSTHKNSQTETNAGSTETEESQLHGEDTAETVGIENDTLVITEQQEKPFGTDCGDELMDSDSTQYNLNEINAEDKIEETEVIAEECISDAEVKQVEHVDNSTELTLPERIISSEIDIEETEVAETTEISTNTTLATNINKDVKEVENTNCDSDEFTGLGSSETIVATDTNPEFEVLTERTEHVDEDAHYLTKVSDISNNENLIENKNADGEKCDFNTEMGLETRTVDDDTEAVEKDDFEKTREQSEVSAVPSRTENDNTEGCIPKDMAESYNKSCTPTESELVANEVVSFDHNETLETSEPVVADMEEVTVVTMELIKDIGKPENEPEATLFLEETTTTLAAEILSTANEMRTVEPEATAIEALEMDLESKDIEHYDSILRNNEEESENKVEWTGQSREVVKKLDSCIEEVSGMVEPLPATEHNRSEPLEEDVPNCSSVEEITVGSMEFVRDTKQDEDETEATSFEVNERESAKTEATENVTPMLAVKSKDIEYHEVSDSVTQRNKEETENKIQLAKENFDNSVEAEIENQKSSKIAEETAYAEEIASCDETEEISLLENVTKSQVNGEFQSKVNNNESSMDLKDLESNEVYDSALNKDGEQNVLVTDLQNTNKNLSESVCMTTKESFDCADVETLPISHEIIVSASNEIGEVVEEEIIEAIVETEDEIKATWDTSEELVNNSEVSTVETSETNELISEDTGVVINDSIEGTQNNSEKSLEEEQFTELVDSQTEIFVENGDPSSKSFNTVLKNSSDPNTNLLTEIEESQKCIIHVPNNILSSEAEAMDETPSEDQPKLSINEVVESAADIAEAKTCSQESQIEEFRETENSQKKTDSIIEAQEQEQLGKINTNETSADSTEKFETESVVEALTNSAIDVTQDQCALENVLPSESFDEVSDQNANISEEKPKEIVKPDALELKETSNQKPSNDITASCGFSTEDKQVEETPLVQDLKVNVEVLTDLTSDVTQDECVLENVLPTESFDEVSDQNANVSEGKSKETVKPDELEITGISKEKPYDGSEDRVFSTGDEQVDETSSVQDLPADEENIDNSMSMAKEVDEEEAVTTDSIVQPEVMELAKTEEVSLKVGAEEPCLTAQNETDTSKIPENKILNTEEEPVETELAAKALLENYENKKDLKSHETAECGHETAKTTFSNNNNTSSVGIDTMLEDATARKVDPEIVKTCSKQKLKLKSKLHKFIKTDLLEKITTNSSKKVSKLKAVRISKKRLLTEDVSGKIRIKRRVSPSNVPNKDLDKVEELNTAEELADNIAKLVIKENVEVAEDPSTHDNEQEEEAEQVVIKSGIESQSVEDSTKVIDNQTSDNINDETKQETLAEEPEHAEECTTFQRLPSEYNSEEILAVTTLINMRNKFTSSTYLDDDNVVVETSQEINREEEAENMETIVKTGLKKTSAKEEVSVKKKVRFDEDNLLELMNEKYKTFNKVKKPVKKIEKSRKAEGALLSGAGGGKKYVKRRLLELTTNLSTNEPDYITDHIAEVADLKKKRGRKSNACALEEQQLTNKLDEPNDELKSEPAGNDNPIYPVLLTSRRKSETMADAKLSKSTKNSTRSLKCDAPTTSTVEDAETDFIVPDDEGEPLCKETFEKLSAPKENMLKVSRVCVDGTKIKFKIKPKDKTNKEKPVIAEKLQETESSQNTAERMPIKEKISVQAALLKTRKVTVKLKRMKMPLFATAILKGSNFDSEAQFATLTDSEELDFIIPESPSEFNKRVEPNPIIKSPTKNKNTILSDSPAKTKEHEELELILPKSPTKFKKHKVLDSLAPLSPTTFKMHEARHQIISASPTKYKKREEPHTILPESPTKSKKREEPDKILLESPTKFKKREEHEPIVTVSLTKYKKPKLELAIGLCESNATKPDELLTDDVSTKSFGKTSHRIHRAKSPNKNKKSVKRNITSELTELSSIQDTDNVDKHLNAEPTHNRDVSIDKLTPSKDLPLESKSLKNKEIVENVDPTKKQDSGIKIKSKHKKRLQKISIKEMSPTKEVSLEFTALQNTEIVESVSPTKNPDYSDKITVKSTHKKRLSKNSIEEMSPTKDLSSESKFLENIGVVQNVDRTKTLDSSDNIKVKSAHKKRLATSIEELSLDKDMNLEPSSVENTIVVENFVVETEASSVKIPVKPKSSTKSKSPGFSTTCEDVSTSKEVSMKETTTIQDASIEKLTCITDLTTIKDVPNIQALELSPIDDSPLEEPSSNKDSNLSQELPFDSSKNITTKAARKNRLAKSSFKIKLPISSFTAKTVSNIKAMVNDELTIKDSITTAETDISMEEPPITKESTSRKELTIQEISSTKNLRTAHQKSKLERLDVVPNRDDKVYSSFSAEVIPITPEKTTTLKEHILPHAKIKTEPLDDIHIKEEEDSCEGPMDMAQSYLNIDNGRHAKEFILKPCDVILTEAIINEQADAHRVFRKQRNKKSARVVEKAVPSATSSKRYKTRRNKVSTEISKTEENIPATENVLPILEECAQIKVFEEGNNEQEPKVHKDIQTGTISEEIEESKELQAQTTKDVKEENNGLSNSETSVCVEKEIQQNAAPSATDVETEDPSSSITENVIAELKLLSPESLPNTEDDKEQINLFACLENPAIDAMVDTEKEQETTSNAETICKVEKSDDEQKTAQLLDSSIDIVLGNATFTNKPLTPKRDDPSAAPDTFDSNLSQNVDTVTEAKKPDGVIETTPTKNRLDVLTAEKINSVLAKMLEEKNNMLKDHKDNTNQASTDSKVRPTIRRQTNTEEEGLRKSSNRSSLNSVKQISAKVPDALFADDESESSNADDSTSDVQFFAPILSLDDLLIKKDEPTVDITHTYTPTQEQVVPDTEGGHSHDGLGTPNFTVELEVETTQVSDENLQNPNCTQKVEAQNNENGKCVAGEELNAHLEETDAIFSLSAIADISTIDIPSDLSLNSEYPELLDAMLFEQVRQSIDCMISGTNSAKKWSQDSFATTQAAVNFNKPETTARSDETPSAPITQESDVIATINDPVAANEDAIGVGQETFLGTISSFDHVEVPTTGFDLVGSFTIADFLSDAGSDLFAFPELDKTQSRSNSFSAESNLCETPPPPAIDTADEEASNDKKDESSIQPSANTNSVACDHSYNKDINEVEKPKTKVRKKSTSSNPNTPTALQSSTKSAASSSLNNSDMLQVFSRAKCLPKPFWKVKKTEEIKSSTPKKEETTPNTQNTQLQTPAAALKRAITLSPITVKNTEKKQTVFSMPALELVIEQTGVEEEIHATSSNITVPEAATNTETDKLNENISKPLDDVTTSKSVTDTVKADALEEVKSQNVPNVVECEPMTPPTRPPKRTSTPIEITEVITIPAPIIVQPIIRIQSQTNRLERIDPSSSSSQQAFPVTTPESQPNLTDAPNICQIDVSHSSRQERDSTPTLDEPTKDEYEISTPTNSFIVEELTHTAKGRQTPTQHYEPPTKRLCIENASKTIITKDIFDMLKSEGKLQKENDLAPSSTNTNKTTDSPDTKLVDSKPKQIYIELKKSTAADNTNAEAADSANNSVVISSKLDNDSPQLYTESAQIEEAKKYPESSQSNQQNATKPVDITPTKQKNENLSPSQEPILISKETLIALKKREHAAKNISRITLTEPEPYEPLQPLSPEHTSVKYSNRVADTKSFDEKLKRSPAQRAEEGKERTTAPIKLKITKDSLYQPNQPDDRQQMRAQPVQSKNTPSTTKLYPSESSVRHYDPGTDGHSSSARTGLVSSRKQKESNASPVLSNASPRVKSNIDTNPNKTHEITKISNASKVTAKEDVRNTPPNKFNNNFKIKDLPITELRKSETKNASPCQTATISPRTSVPPKPILAVAPTLLPQNTNRYHPYQRTQTPPNTLNTHKSKVTPQRQNRDSLPLTPENVSHKNRETPKPADKATPQRIAYSVTTLPPSMQSRPTPSHQSSFGTPPPISDLASIKLTAKDEEEIARKLADYRTTLPKAETYGAHKNNQRLLNLQEEKLRLEYASRKAQQLRDTQRLKRKPQPETYETHNKKFAMHSGRTEASNSSSSSSSSSRSSGSGSASVGAGHHHSRTKQYPQHHAPRPRPHHEYVNKFGEIEKLVQKEKVAKDTEPKRSVPLTASTAWEPKMPTGDELIELLSKTKKS